jgi:hypothetical protein
VLLAAVSNRVPLQHHNHQYFRSQHSLYQLGRAEDIFFFDPFCIPENQLQHHHHHRPRPATISISTAQNCACKNNGVDFFCGLK